MLHIGALKKKQTRAMPYPYFLAVGARHFFPTFAPFGKVPSALARV